MFSIICGTALIIVTGAIFWYFAPTQWPGGNADIARAKTIQADIADEYAKYGIK